jgi:hypothetical protein
VKHITQVLQERSGEKKIAKPKDRKGNKKNFSRQMKTKEIRKNSSWKGKPRQRRKKKTFCMFLDSYSLKNEFEMFGAKDGPTKIELNMNELLIIMYLTSVDSMCEMVLILNNYKKV